VNDEQATADGSPVERDGEQHRRGEESTDEPALESEFGITDEDMKQIRSFLAKQSHLRSVDDLRPSSKR